MLSHLLQLLKLNKLFRHLMRASPCPQLRLTKINEIITQMWTRATSLQPTHEDHLLSEPDLESKPVCEFARQALAKCIAENSSAGADGAMCLVVKGVEFDQEFLAKVYYYNNKAQPSSKENCLALCDPTKPFGFRQCHRAFHPEESIPYIYRYDDSHRDHPTFEQIQSNGNNMWWPEGENEKVEFNKGDEIVVGYNFYIDCPAYKPETKKINLQDFIDFFTTAYLEFDRPCYNDQFLAPFRHEALVTVFEESFDTPTQELLGVEHDLASSGTCAESCVRAYRQHQLIVDWLQRDQQYRAYFLMRTLFTAAHCVVAERQAVDVLSSSSEEPTPIVNFPGQGRAALDTLSEYNALAHDISLHHAATPW